MQKLIKFSALTAIILFLVTHLAAQKNDNDKLRELQRELTKKRFENQKEFMQRPDVDSLQKAILALSRYRKDYMSFIIDIANTFADVQQFNSYLNSKALASINKNFTGFGFGFGWKRGNRISALQILLLNIGHKTSNDSLKVTVNSETVFNYTWGYDFLKSEKIDLYPFFGLGARDINLYFKKKNYTPPVQTDPSQLFQKNNFVNLQSNFIAYYLGVGFDWKVIDNPTGGTILGLRYSYSNKIGKGKFKPDIGELEFDPGIKFNQAIMLSIKFFGKI